MTPSSERFRTESAEVVYATQGLVTVDATEVAELKRAAAANARRRVRLCAHLGTGDTVHEMLIVHERSCYVRPHKHIGKSESFHVIEGSVDVVLFDEDGAIENAIAMGSYESGKPFYYRIAEPRYHTLIIRSDVLVFHETTSGPFRREQTVLAPWSPAGDDEAEAYLAHVNATVARLRANGRGA